MESSVYTYAIITCNINACVNDELLITSTWGKSEILEEICFCYLQISLRPLLLDESTCQIKNKFSEILCETEALFRGQMCRWNHDSPPFT